MPLYRPVPAGDTGDATADVALTAVPYFLWANRSPDAMRVWIPLT